MTQDFEALVSHLHFVGGRPVNAPPPGALIQLAPHNTARNRERDAFFVLVLPQSGRAARPVFYEQLARWAAARYFESEGGVTLGMQRVLTTLNDNLLQHNTRHPEQPFYAHAICLVLRQQEVYIARTDGAAALLWQAGGLRAFPEDVRAASGAQPLGQAAQPFFQVTRYVIEAGDVLALASSSVLHLGREALAGAGQRGNVQATVDRLKGHTLVEAAAMVLQFVPPGEPVLLPVEAAPVEEPQSTVPVTEPQPTGREPSRLWRRSRATQDSLAEAAAAVRPRLDELQQEGRTLRLRLGQRILRLLQRAMVKIVATLHALRRALNRLLPEPEPGRPPSLPTPIAASAAVLIPVAVVLLVVAYSLNTRDETAFERCLSQAQEAAGAAELVEQSSPARAQEAWFGVLEVTNRCLPRRPDDPLLVSIREKAQRRLDAFGQIVRCPMVPLQRYEPGARLRGPILRSDVDLYVLDATRSILYRERLNQAGNAVVGDSEILVQRNAAVGQYIVRQLVDIDWLTETGVARGSVLVALDRQGVLVTYSPTFPPATAQALVGADRWVDPVAIATWQGRLYILDPVANQIWRYQPEGGSFPAAPEEYFVGDNRPDLRNAVDMAIDQTGNVYVLRSDGTLSKYYSGESQFFQFSNLPSGAVGSLGSASGMYLDTGLISPGFYILDAPNQVMYETTLGGTFIRGYRAPSEFSFRDLSGLVVDSAAENLYLLARETLYHVPKCQ